MFVSAAVGLLVVGTGIVLTFVVFRLVLAISLFQFDRLRIAPGESSSGRRAHGPGRETGIDEDIKDQDMPPPDRVGSAPASHAIDAWDRFGYALGGHAIGKAVGTRTTHPSEAGQTMVQGSDERSSAGAIIDLSDWIRPKRAGPSDRNDRAQNERADTAVPAPTGSHFFADGRRRRKTKSIDH